MMMAFKEFLSGGCRCHANYRSSLLGNWIGNVWLFCLSCFSYLPRVPYELVLVTFLPQFLSLCFPQSSFSRFFPLLDGKRRKITVTSHARINVGDEKG